MQKLLALLAFSVLTAQPAPAAVFETPTETLGPLELKCEFLGTNPNPPLGQVAIAGGSAVVAAPGVANHPGIISIRSHASNANSGGAWGVAANAFLISGGEHFEAVVRIDRVTNVTTYIGFQDTFSAAAPVDGAYFVIQSGGTVIGQTSVASSPSSTATLGTLSTGTWYRLVGEVDTAAANVSFYVYSESGTIIGSGSVNATIPSVAGQETGFGVASTLATGTGSANDLVTMDYLAARFNRALVR